ncbi:hypothetical protein ACHAW5_009884 [Stephanodiscus triporus]|uniref:Uncharacterized protein n=1 Tax=Stephanodiscus triporus TaxID=2934178 RepID=A0ABD3Q391_9STRA
MMISLTRPIRSTSEKIDEGSSADGNPHLQQPTKPSFSDWPTHHHPHAADVMRNSRRRRRGTPEATAVTESTSSSFNEPHVPTTPRPRVGRFRLTGGLGGVLRRRGGGVRPGRPGPSESEVRRKARKHAERGDWAALRKLVNGHKFSRVPEVEPRRPGPGHGGDQQQQQQPSSVAPVQPQHEKTARRPSYGSYGSRGEGRRSFTRDTNSAAAAAIIKAADMLEESEVDGEGGGTSSSRPGSSSSSSSSSRNPRNPLAEDRPDYGENVLHDVCRFHPPLDVVETLLVALRRRQECTIGTDEAGRTPLHVAAECGAGADVIRALVCADPTPASMGDVHRRSPLHLAMRYCIFHYQPTPHHHHADKMLPPNEVIEETFQVVKVLKEAMLDYPGKIDFKDEDASGYSPLDYAIDGDISREELIQALVRRRDPKLMRSSFSSSNLAAMPQKSIPPKRMPFSRRKSSISSKSTETGGDLDIEILRRLERDEIEARRHRIHRMKARSRKDRMSCSLFDAFGIQEEPTSPSPVAAAAVAPVAATAHKLESQTRVENELPSKAPAKAPAKAPVITPDEAPVEAPVEAHAKAPARASAVEIYNRHLEDYLNDHCEDEFEEFLEQGDDEGFDIFKDPELVEPHLRPARRTPPPRDEELDDSLPFISEITFTLGDDDCVSVGSDISGLL